MSRLGTLGTLLDRVRRNRVNPATRLRLADLGPIITKAPPTPPPVSEDSPEIVVAPSSVPVIESVLPSDIESVPPSSDSEPPVVETRPRSEKPTTPGMPQIDTRPLESPRLESPRLESPRLESPRLESPRLVTPPLELAPEMAEVRLPDVELDAPFETEPRIESEPSPMSAPDPVTAPRIVVDEALAGMDDDHTSPAFRVAQKTALERARTVPLDEAHEELAPPPLPINREVELTPTPTPPPAPAIEEAVRAGSLKLTPVSISPMRLEARNVGEFIGEAQRTTPATFGDAVDGSLSLQLPPHAAR